MGISADGSISLGGSAAAGGAAGLAAAGSAAGPGLSAIAMGAGLGSSLPVVGTVIGAAIGAIIAIAGIGAMHKDMDDSTWDDMGNQGSKGHEPNGLNISSFQQMIVDGAAAGISSHPNWQVTWPMTWQNMAHGTNGCHSPLFADAVARKLGAPQGGAPMHPPAPGSTSSAVQNAINNLLGGAAALASGNAQGYLNATGANLAASGNKLSSSEQAALNTIKTASNINPKTGLAYPNNGLSPAQNAMVANGINPQTGLPYMPGQGPGSGMQLPPGGLNFNSGAGVSGILGAKTFTYDPTVPIVLTAPQKAALAAGKPMPNPDGSPVVVSAAQQAIDAAYGVSLSTIENAATAGKSIPLPTGANISLLGTFAKKITKPTLWQRIEAFLHITPKAPAAPTSQMVKKTL